MKHAAVLSVSILIVSMQSLLPLYSLWVILQHDFGQLRDVRLLRLLLSSARLAGRLQTS